jgi:hypothetical protein
VALFPRRRSAAAGASSVPVPVPVDVDVDVDVAQRAAIDGFWAWWRAGGAASTAAAVDAGEAATIADEISRRVGAMAPGLGWELGPGRTARHVLMVTPEGDANLRALARRWRRAAPAPDDVWEYADARRQASDLAQVSLGLAGVTIAAGEVQVSARVDGAEVDVGVYHPAFAHLSDTERTRAAFLLLDQALGEADVETWVGAVSALTLPPIDPFPLTSLPAVVRQVEADWTDEDGGPAWILGEATADTGLPILVTTQVPLKPATAPHLDTYVAVAVPYRERTGAGLPESASLIELRRLEEHLVSRLGGSGRVVAHQSCDGVRVLHVYVDGTTPAAEQVRTAVGGWGEGTVRLEVRSDPGWDAVAHLRP